MRVTFVKPNITDQRASDAMTPLAFGYLSALTPPHVERVLYDERLEAIPFDDPTDLVAVTVETYTARRSYQIAAEYRRRGVPVVLGGHHPTLMPEEALPHADSVVMGDAEQLWPLILNDARAGRLRPLYRQDAPPPMTGVFPDRTIFKGKRYAPIPLVQTGRGCRFACDFCSIHAFYGRHLRQRPILEILGEIEELDARHVFLVDDNLFSGSSHTEALLEGLAQLGVRWSCQMSIDVARNAKLMNLLAKSGCISVLIGFESLDQANLRQMRKHWNVKDLTYDEAIERFKDAGVMIYGTFVHGYDGDTSDSFDRNLEFAMRHRLFLANFNPLTPTPGTALYGRLAREGRLLNDPWWLDPEYRYGRATFHPRGMTARELEEGCYRARTRFNTMASIARRALDRRTNFASPYALGVFLAANIISRIEIHRKQNAPLGIPEASVRARGTPSPPGTMR